MPILAPLVPATASGGAIVGGGTTVAGGITVTQAVTVGVVIASAVTVGVLIDDYLDTPVTETEADEIRTQAGAQSRADRDAVRNCQDCIWCQINIQAQGNFFERGGRPDVQGIGPYFRSGRTIFAREGVIVAGLTHEFAEGIARRRDFRDVVSWGILAKTVQYILSRPPGGLPPGEHRAGGTERYASDARYDIMIPPGSINAFMA